MRSRILTLALVVPVAVACSAGSNDAKGPGVVQAGAAAKVDKAADEAAIRAIYQKFAALYTAGNSAGIAAAFADDGIEIQAGAPAARGREAIQKMLTGMFASMKITSLNTDGLAVNVADAGDLATVEGPYRFSFTDVKGKKQEDHGTTL